MALPTPVNGMITDAVTQANVKVLGDAPAMAMGAISEILTFASGGWSVWGTCPLRLRTKPFTRWPWTSKALGCATPSVGCRCANKPMCGAMYRAPASSPCEGKAQGIQGVRDAGAAPPVW
jgi:hypothetical protein